ncbi:MAG: DUF2029 domain-containing protein, partial [Myxococcales bacterium]|nr:DUF2029 domain-containing protein [Myxococcales bacterium]
MPRPAAVAAALLGCLICAIVLHLAQVRADAAWIVAAVVPWGVAVSLGVREDVPLLRVLALAAVARLTLVGTPPLLSDDLYRYLFEGQALLAGHNPFVEPPATLAALDPALAARVNHADIPSIYPPVALLWFQLLALFGSAAWIPQLGAALVDVGNAGLLHRLLDRDGRPTWPAALYALHPLPVLESAQGGHLEPLAVLACLGFLVLLPRRPWLASAAMTAGIGVKLLPVLFVPTLVRRLGPARALAAVTIGGLALVALAAPVLSAGPALFEALGT